MLIAGLLVYLFVAGIEPRDRLATNRPAAHTRHEDITMEPFTPTIIMAATDRGTCYPIGIASSVREARGMYKSMLWPNAKAVKECPDRIEFWTQQSSGVYEIEEVVRL